MTFVAVSRLVEKCLLMLYSSSIATSSKTNAVFWNNLIYFEVIEVQVSIWAECNLCRRVHKYESFSF